MISGPITPPSDHALREALKDAVVGLKSGASGNRFLMIAFADLDPAKRLRAALMRQFNMEELWIISPADMEPYFQLAIASEKLGPEGAEGFLKRYGESARGRVSFPEKHFTSKDPETGKFSIDPHAVAAFQLSVQKVNAILKDRDISHTIN